jgi:hypothetical protein
MPIAEDSVYAALRQVHDPELLVNIVDLGLVRTFLSLGCGIWPETRGIRRKRQISECLVLATSRRPGRGVQRHDAGDR